MWEIAFLIFCIFFFKWPCVNLGKALLLATMLSLGSLSCRDKAPGQRECDFSIDGINKCIRDIEQASLAAVSQSLATRDDISVEVRQKAQAQTEQCWTPCCSNTAQSTARKGRSVLTGIFLGKVRPKCITSSKIPESPGNSRVQVVILYCHPHSGFLCWYDRLTVFVVSSHVETRVSFWRFIMYLFLKLGYS